jgi:lipopolysaccharide biosynthesis glycosyltransferase
MVVGHVNRISADVAGAIPAVDLSMNMPWDEMRVPYHCKFYVWRYVSKEYDRLIWVDTDLSIIRPIMEDELPDVPFAAVEDHWQVTGPEGHKRKLLTKDRNVFRTYQQYFNAGVMICRRDAAKVFDEAFKIRNDMFRSKRHNRREHEFMDQDHFNYAVWTTLGDGERNTGWYALDRKYNEQTPENAVDDAIVLHFCGPNKDVERMERLNA